MADPLSARHEAQAIELLGLFLFFRCLVLPLILPLGNLSAGIGTEFPSRARVAPERDMTKPSARHPGLDQDVQPECRRTEPVWNLQSEQQVEPKNGPFFVAIPEGGDDVCRRPQKPG